MATAALSMLSAEQTADCLPFGPLCEAVAQAARDYAAGRITSPERQVLPLPNNGVLLSMPATASDIGIHKLVNVCPGNGALGLPTIHGVVAVYDAATGAPRAILDGPTVTGRRTAAVSMLAIRTLARSAPRHVALIGAGKQASDHAKALAALYPGIRVDVHTRAFDRAEAFVRDHAGLALDLRPAFGPVDAAAEVVITLTNSLTPVYDETPRPDRLLVGVGAFKPEMAEYGPTAVHGSAVFLDDPAGGRHEAGDLIQAGFDWAKGRSLVDALEGRVDADAPRLFKSVGCAAWDLAAGRCALAHLG
ncbi:bifunctional Delta(1)-pyrroline-2-carboxylate/Delta(1)-piperideine-2-carboxylate reductase [Azospirillum rugosum]|uniref:1-piperideine-2-carboxylate/1-pyrroline-2-carboxylate reductase [NAD(P)H] n=1 Tax=Azospirillum rugosum TaxID=416170 RepID=A0ABS4SSH1_9PROT|nr:bifunctional Delta(1)-pyrroline-2-carboxylate/Delta(1)-piperideine-2-carboxylate reductase [Azospirillum rugosum]MBP2295509.1 1-piperideine-2-carboxylate/1-pyrroline-2-carboxylate reductase [NAD(P)H] [Azospirillum rugosum]MDQ0528388.1 1-piperideine-2-carboxylate/1-pyrroline-2-carboxylate reductase [NAD(P)H] [Azospirillum rugosum]